MNTKFFTGFAVAYMFLHLGQVFGQQTEYRIAYNVAVKGQGGKTNYEVFTMNLDGTNPQNITQHPDVAWTYRAHGDKLYFISDRDTCYRCFFLYETDSLGKNVRKVSSLQLEDSWMDTRNNGKEIIVSGRIGKKVRYQLFLINSDNGNFTQLTKDTAAIYKDPAFSPDGNKIACVYNPAKRNKKQYDELYTLNIDGTGLRQITKYPQAFSANPIPGYTAGCTHWHPTENFISYISLQGGKHGIYAVNPDTKKQWKISTGELSEGWHDWSDDGTYLVYDSSNKDDSQYHIILKNWLTKEVKQLTDETYNFQQSPVFLKK